MILGHGVRKLEKIYMHIFLLSAWERREKQSDTINCLKCIMLLT